MDIKVLSSSLTQFRPASLVAPRGVFRLQNVEVRGELHATLAVLFRLVEIDDDGVVRMCGIADKIDGADKLLVASVQSVASGTQTEKSRKTV